MGRTRCAIADRYGDFESDFNFGLDKGPDCQGVEGRVRHALSGVTHVSCTTIFCFLHQIHLIVKCSLGDLDAVSWSDAWPTERIKKVLCLCCHGCRQICSLLCVRPQLKPDPDGQSLALVWTKTPCGRKSGRATGTMWHASLKTKTSRTQCASHLRFCFPWTCFCSGRKRRMRNCTIASRRLRKTEESTLARHHCSSWSPKKANYIARELFKFVEPGDHQEELWRNTPDDPENNQLGVKLALSQYAGFSFRVLLVVNRLPLIILPCTLR